tara:strand:+ start:967 stop:1914 length:948 start_codon:yes stop_codon:yes gene_type:complete
MIDKLFELDQAVFNFSDEGKLWLDIVIGFIMFGIALGLKSSDFKILVSNPKPILLGFLSQFVLMPILTFLLAISLSQFISPSIGLGMILVAACPGGNVSNYVSSLAKGNIALSVSLTALSSVSSIVLTPLNFTVWGNLFLNFYGQNNNLMSIPTLSINIWDVFSVIIVVIGIPLILGILLNTKFPKVTTKIYNPIKRLSAFPFFGLIGLLFYSNIELFLTYIQYVFIIVLIHNLLAFLLGYYFAKFNRLELLDRRTISIETGIQNSGLALALLFNPLIFPADFAIGGLAFIAGLWGIWHIISGFSIAVYWNIRRQ